MEVWKDLANALFLINAYRERGNSISGWHIRNDKHKKLDEVQEKANEIEDCIEEEYYEDAISELDDLRSTTDY